MTTKTKRRSVLAGVAALSATVALPAAAQADEPLLRMEADWRAFLDYCHQYPDQSDEAMDPLFDRLTDMEVAIIETPAATPRGLLSKARVARHIASGSPVRESVVSEPDLEWGRLSDDRMIWFLVKDLERLVGEGTA